MKIAVVAGARPNFVKIAPIMHAFRAQPALQPILVHTGQHYDEAMSAVFFRELEIPEPDFDLGVGSGTHAVQTAKTMLAFEPFVLRERPDAVLVVGDVNSTVACGLVAAKVGVLLIHVEAGLRSFDRTMPEEINRVVTDAISGVLFCSEESGVRNLRAEGIPQERVHLVGNVMIDTLRRNVDKARASDILDRLRLAPGEYAVLTLHRPSNVDDQETLSGILGAVRIIQEDLPVVFPVHPRTRGSLERPGLAGQVEGMGNLRLLDPVGYLEFLRLMSGAKVVLTDSGGIQEETTILEVPCLTLRENTERPVTVEMGSNRVVGTDPQKIVAAYREVKEGRCASPKMPPLWDGHAAERIAAILNRLASG